MELNIFTKATQHTSPQHTCLQTDTPQGIAAEAALAVPFPYTQRSCRAGMLTLWLCRSLEDLIVCLMKLCQEASAAVAVKLPFVARSN